jgi:hypothetical protein
MLALMNNKSCWIATGMLGLTLSQRPRVLAHGLQPHVEQPAPVNRQSSHLKEMVLVVLAVRQRTAHVLEQFCSKGEGQQERCASDDGSVEGTQGELAI